MSGKLFGQIVLLVVIAVLISSVAKCAKMHLMRKMCKSNAKTAQMCPTYEAKKK